MEDLLPSVNSSLFQSECLKQCGKQHWKNVIQLSREARVHFIKSVNEQSDDSQSDVDLV